MAPLQRPSRAQGATLTNLELIASIMVAHLREAQRAGLFFAFTVALTCIQGRSMKGALAGQNIHPCASLLQKKCLRQQG